MSQRIQMVLMIMAAVVFSSVIALASTVDLPKTGQTTSYATGDDGDLQLGVAWPSPRFTDNGDGTVTDNLTGLMWAENANLDGVKTWADALSYVNALNLAGYDDRRLLHHNHGSVSPIGFLVLFFQFHKENMGVRQKEFRIYYFNHNCFERKWIKNRVGRWEGQLSKSQTGICPHFFRTL